MEEDAYGDEPWEAVADDLAELIQDAGMVPARVSTFGQNVMKAIGSWDVDYTATIVKKELAELPKDQFSSALTYALRLAGPVTGASDTLTDRRARFRKFERDWSDVSDDTLRRWEKRAIKLLARRLVAFGERARLNPAQAREEHEEFMMSTGTPDSRIRVLQARSISQASQIKALQEQNRHLIRALDSVRMVLMADDPAQWALQASKSFNMEQLAEATQSARHATDV